MNRLNTATKTGQPVVCNSNGASRVVLVCEHASFHIPEEFNALGLSDAAVQSHAVWDPGAMAVARGLSERLDAPLVAASVSRLVYDCNRPATAPDAMPSQSEIYQVPGNANLTTAQRQDRIARFYDPFCAQLADVVSSKIKPILITIHSFTPVFNGQTRTVEIGVLHDTDHRLADALLKTATSFTAFDVQRNAPYGPEHGVMHTLNEHAIPAAHLNVMLEIRNDLIGTAEQQNLMADMIAFWLSAAIKDVQATKDHACPA